MPKGRSECLRASECWGFRLRAFPQGVDLCLCAFSSPAVERRFRRFAVLSHRK